jgi:uncharacterized protein YeeX (DUF496 family)
VDNLSQLNFIKEELNILNYGFQYSIEKPITANLLNIAIETENAIKLLDINLQSAYHVMTAKKLKLIMNSCISSNHMHKRQSYILKQLRNKLISNNVILVPADKVRTIVAIDNTEYEKKVHDFLIRNQFSTHIRDPTKKYQKQLLKVLQHTDNIINKYKAKHLIQDKPKPPKLNAQLKLHKTDIPIRPVVNNINAPTYKVAKFLTQILNEYHMLSIQYNITNLTNLANDILKLKINDNHKFISYDIEDLFVNISIYETLNITTKSR